MTAYLDPTPKAEANCGPRGQNPRVQIYTHMLCATNLPDLLVIRETD